MASIPDVPEASTFDRIRYRRAHLVIDLVTKHGEFWQAISAVRSRWGIDAQTMIAVTEDRLPWLGTRPWEAPVYIPAAWPLTLPPSPLPEPTDPSRGFYLQDPEDNASWMVDQVNRLGQHLAETEAHFRRFVEGGEHFELGSRLFGEDLSTEIAAELVQIRQGEEQERAGYCQMLWWLDLRRLHDLFVPPPYRVRYAEPAVAGAWNDFFALCLVYDPCPDRLRQFVNAAMGPLPDIVDLPIVPVWETQEEDVREALDSAGITLELPEKLKPRRKPGTRPVTFHIVPDEYTSKGEAEEAFNLLTPGRKGGRKWRDPLLAVQIAIWMDSYGMTVADIANTLGWELRDNAYGKKRRSDAVSDHAKEGRGLLAERNRSAADFNSF